MQITVLDANSLGLDVNLSILESLGNVTVYGYTYPEEMAERIVDTDVIITNKVLLNQESLQNAKQLKQICLTATGSNNVDLEYTKQRGIRVCNVVGYSTDSVVQHTFAMLFYLMEHLAYYDEYVKSESYVKDSDFTHFKTKFHELSGKTLGIIGLGRIGETVAGIATAFGAKVIYYSTSGNNNHPKYKRVSFDDLLTSSDIVSIHAPLNKDTYHLMDQVAFGKMKSTAMLLNLGRGDIIVEADLLDALVNETISCAGIDVLSVEPMAEDCPLRKFKDSNRLLITPHIAWASVESRNRVIQEIKLNIEAYLAGDERCVL